MSDVYLGLDVSTTHVGYALLDSSAQLLNYGTINLTSKSFADELDKYVFIKDKLEEIKKEFKPNKIFIETALMVFKFGRSSASVLQKLNRFNGAVTLLCFQIFDLKPNFIGATQARKMCGIIIPKGSKVKQIVVQFLLDKEASFKVQYTSKGNIKPSCFDSADAIVIAKAGLLLSCLKKKSKS